MKRQEDTHSVKYLSTKNMHESKKYAYINSHHAVLYSCMNLYEIYNEQTLIINEDKISLFKD